MSEAALAGEAATGALAGRHALVTGGGRGIGAAISKRLAGLGAAVTVLGRDLARLEETAAALPIARAVPCDVTDEATVDRAFAQAVAESGDLHILVNNAGAALSAPLAKTTLEQFRAMIEVNLTGAFLCCRAALPGMTAAGTGRIVNIASTAGLKGAAYVSAYCAAKHGLVGLTRALALETADKGITVNAVCPGYTETDMARQAIATIVEKTGRSEAEARAELVKTNPQGRLVQPEEVAATVAFLCLPGAQAITGQALVLAGGEVT
jgi:NAD(P)-dependent dehydrogenase (short-subunit alcohol dehydrogenase family)